MSRVPHPSLFSSEGWETSTLNQPRSQGALSPVLKKLPMKGWDAVLSIHRTTLSFATTMPRAPKGRSEPLKTSRSG
jgi:hypothetical protein